MRVVTFDLDEVAPEHLEELAQLLRHQQHERIARLSEMLDQPALGAYRTSRAERRSHDIVDLYEGRA